MINRLLWTTLVLGACFDPDLTQKACIDDRGCPEGYFCVAGKCAQTAGGDMSVDPRPKRTEIEVRESASFYMGTMLNDGFNDRPSYLRSVPGPYFLDEREVTVAEYRACVDAKVCEKPVTGAYGTQGLSHGHKSGAPSEIRPAGRPNGSGWRSLTAFHRREISKI